MVITEIDKEDVIRLAHANLELDESMDIDEKFMATSLRRIAGIHCPCSASRLKKIFYESISPVADETIDLISECDKIIEKLIVCGDLVEAQREVATELPVGTLYAAPLSFSKRSDNDVFVFGIVPDENNPFGQFASRVELVGFKRIIRAVDGEDLPSQLTEAGLIYVEETEWLKLPDLVSPGELVSKANVMLKQANSSGQIPDLLIIDTQRDPRFYAGRWVSPTDQSGVFVARRPRAYGSPLWCFALLQNGEVKSFFDFSPEVFQVKRACDAAWWIQLAIDSLNNNPQKVLISPDGDHSIIKFFSPIPAWAERKLMMTGLPVKSSGCLFAYRLENSELTSISQFLQKYLWLTLTV